MKIVEKNFGTSILRIQYVLFSNSCALIFNSTPIIIASQKKDSIGFSVYDNCTFSGVNIYFKFAKVPTHARAFYGAAKILARELFRILYHGAEIDELVFFTYGKKTTDAAKSGLALLKKLGMKIN